MPEHQRVQPCSSRLRTDNPVSYTAQGGVMLPWYVWHFYPYDFYPPCRTIRQLFTWTDAFHEDGGKSTLRCWRTKYPHMDYNGNRERAAEITIRAPEIRQLIKWCNDLSDISKM